MGSPTENDKNFVSHVQSSVRLDALDQMTSVLDRELVDSQRMMGQMKSMFASITKLAQPVDNELRQEDLAKFLEADVPNLLLPDMVESTLGADVNEIVATMKGYAEDLKKKYTDIKPYERATSKELNDLDMEQYAISLDQLSKRLANIKFGKVADNNRNLELEQKLSQLCLNVNFFTQIVEAKAALSEHNKNWTETRHSHEALCYDDAINKLLSGINEVTYLLKNK